MFHQNLSVAFTDAKVEEETYAKKSKKLFSEDLLQDFKGEMIA
jgi:hypothetical protein